MKKILIFTDTWEQVNGVVTTMKNIIKNLPEDYEALVIDPAKFKTYPVPFYKDVKLAIPFGIGKFFHLYQPDFVHIVTEGPIGLAALIYCVKNKIPFTSAYHTQWDKVLKRIAGVPEALTSAYLRWFHGLALRTMVTNNSMKEYLESKNFSSNLQIISRGVDPEIFKYKFHLKTELNIRLLYAGRISKEKNLEALLEYSNNSAFHVTIVGDGPDRDELMKKYPQAVFKTFVFGDALAEEYQLADIFVFPSLTDTFGLVIIEALACGTPVIAFKDAMGVKEIISIDNGHLVDEYIAEGVAHCIALMPFRYMISKKTQDKYSWKNVTDDWVKFLEPITSDGLIA